MRLFIYHNPFEEFNYYVSIENIVYVYLYSEIQGYWILTNKVLGLGIGGIFHIKWHPHRNLKGANLKGVGKFLIYILVDKCPCPRDSSANKELKKS